MNVQCRAPTVFPIPYGFRAVTGPVTRPTFIRCDFRFAPSQWETALLCNDVSYWLGASLESTLVMMVSYRHLCACVEIFNHRDGLVCICTFAVTSAINPLARRYAGTSVLSRSPGVRVCDLASCISGAFINQVTLTTWWPACYNHQISTLLISVHISFTHSCYVMPYYS